MSMLQRAAMILFFGIVIDLQGNKTMNVVTMHFFLLWHTDELARTHTLHLLKERLGSARSIVVLTTHFIIDIMYRLQAKWVAKCYSVTVTDADADADKNNRTTACYYLTTFIVLAFSVSDYTLEVKFKLSCGGAAPCHAVPIWKDSWAWHMILCWMNIPRGIACLHTPRNNYNT